MTSALAAVATEKPHHRILVCLDGSPFSEVCLPYAISIAKAFGSEVTLCDVMEPHQLVTGPQPSDALNWEISRQEARAYLERHEQVIATALGRPVEIRLEQGHAAERIVALAHELDADLTMLGSHSEGGVTAWHLGSTVQQVLAVARSSVFVARSAAAPSIGTPTRLLVPLDGSSRTESVLPTAARLASAYSAELLLVHVVHEPVANSVLCAGADLELAKELATRVEASATRYLENVRARLVYEVAAVRTLVVRHAHEHRCLIELSQRERVDVVVLAAHGAGCDPAESFGSVTAHLLTQSNVPLLVLQDLASARSDDRATQLAPPLRASYPPEVV